MTGEILVAIVDNQEIFRMGLECLIDGRPGMRVVASVPAATDLLALGVAPTVVVIDAETLTEISALETVAQLGGRYRVLAISNEPRPAVATTATRAGAHGLVSRRASSAEIALAIEATARGAVYLSAPWSARPDNGLELEGELLSPREEEALCHIARGLTHAQAATRMGIAVATLNTYARRIRTKLQVGNKAQMARKAIELGLPV